ncbi:Cardiolipin synthetase [Enhygromyxa salina]|uniref:Cardiolipin synthase n=1 Tax=Enhygromyxa salina TaxID=215803 RepID=A0A0C1ZYW8_9BACT|nr:cardiolipin synthase [Enhygromyxa salina]KIG16438.1 Cardiolipin synthetase [Enhygromyxa salina]
MIEWSQELLLAIEIGLLAYGVFAGITIVLERRRPAATLAWILVLVLVPVVGLVAYLLIGRRKARRSRRSRRRLRLRPTEATAEIANLEASPETMTPQVTGLLHLALSHSAAPIRHANGVEILRPRPAFEAIELAIAAAQHRIHLQFYIWRGDSTGQRLIELLTERAAAGVKVRLLYDDIGSIGTPLRHFEPLQAAGGEVARFGPLRLRFARPSGRLDFRNHRKLLCIDGELGFTGGLNVGDEYRGASRSGRVWNDLFVRMTGDAVLGLEAVFVEDWLTATDELVELYADLPHRDATRSMLERPSTPVTSTGPLVQIIPSGPDQTRRRGENNASVIAATFVAAIGTALERVWIVTPYFIPDEPLILILQTAAMRGVDVKILVPNPTDNDLRLVAWAARSYYDELIAVGCEIHEYRPGMIHAKYMVIDDSVAMIGSANMDVRSLYLNYEVTAMFYDGEVTKALAQVFLDDLADGVQVCRKDRTDLRLRWRLAEGFARILSPLL